MNMEVLSVDDQLKTTKKKVTFADSMRPFYYFLRLFGLLPFSITYDLNGQPHASRVSVLDVLWFTISTLLYSTITYLVFRSITIPQETATASYILILGDDLLLLANMFFGILFVGIDMFNRYELVNTLKEFDMFDTAVSIDELKYY